MSKINSTTTSFAFAPASIGNVSIGFDILGMAISGAGDQIKLTIRKEKGIIFKSIDGVVNDLPVNPEKNTASAALLSLIHGEKLKHGFEIELLKGIPMGSGMGGSAASAVAAVVAAAGLTKNKIPKEVLFEYALEGEKIASGAAHPDNVAPCLYGGLTLASLNFKNPVITLPVPKNIYWALVHPDIELKTHFARSILKKEVPLAIMVEQTAHLASFIAGLYNKDLTLIRQGFNDLIIEPQRSQFIPAFDKIKKLVLKNKKSIGFSISGSGPSVFMWTEDLAEAKKMGILVQKEFKNQKVNSQLYFGNGNTKGAHLIKKFL